MLIGAVTKVNRFEHGFFGFWRMLRIAPSGVKIRNTRAGNFWELPLGRASVATWISHTK